MPAEMEAAELAAPGRSAGESRFVVDFSRPLEAFSTVGAKAFAASDPAEAGANYIALIGIPGVPRREDVLRMLLDRPASRVLSPIHDGLIEVEDGKFRTLTVLPKPAGDRVLPPMASGEDHPTDSIIRRIVVPQLAEALAELKFRGITHRNIRPECLYWNDSRKSQIVLGECFSAPAGVHQMAEAELLGRSQALRFGRGEGTLACDYAAIGVLIMILLAGRVPKFDAEGMELAMLRAIRGSSVALTSNFTATASFVNLVRGLISDDASAQWGIEHIKQWAGGIEPQLRLSTQLDQFLRPCKFGSITLGGRRALARTLGLKPKESAAFLRSEGFGNWMQNALSDGAAVTRLKQAIQNHPTSAQDEILVLKIRLALDPTSAVTVGGFEIAMDGIGPALAAAFAENDTGVKAAIHRGFVSGLFQAAFEIDIPHVHAQRDRRTQLNAIAQYTKGSNELHGLERALYDLNPGLSCLSPRVIEANARGVKDLLQALDRLAAAGEIKGALIDAHIEGFIAARSEGRDNRIDHLTRARGDPIEELVATMKVLESLQAAYHKAPLENLTRWAAEVLAGAVRLLRNKPRRESALMKLDSLASSGSFTELSRGFDFKSMKERDTQEYKSAISSWLNNEARADFLLTRTSGADPNAIQLGQRAAAIVAHSLFGLSVIFTLIRFLL